MKNSIIDSLVLAIQQEFGNTICEDEISVSLEGVILFVVETEKGRLEFSISFTESEDYHTVEIDVAFLSSDEELAFYDFSTLDLEGYKKNFLPAGKNQLG